MEAIGELSRWLCQTDINIFIYKCNWQEYLAVLMSSSSWLIFLQFKLLNVLNVYVKTNSFKETFRFC